MKARQIKIIALTALLLLIGQNLIMAQLSLDSCHSKALANYPLIQQYGLIEQSKEISLSNANKTYLPQFDITLIGGVIDGMPSFSQPGTSSSSSAQANLITIGQINQVIWDGGMTKASKGIIEANTQIEMADLDVNLYQLRDRVNNLYFGVLLIEEQISQLELHKETLHRNQKLIQEAIDNGTAYQSDADELMVEVFNVEQKQSDLVYNKMAYVKVLSTMIGEDIVDGEVFVRPVVSTSIDGLSNNRPELVKFNNQRSLVEASAQMNKAMLFPKFGVLAFGTFLTPGIEFGTSDITNIVVAGVSVSWSLSPLYKNGNNKKLTNINLSRIQNQKETFLFNTNLELTQTDIELKRLHNTIEQDKEILKLKTSIKDSYSVKYENGIATMSQFLDRMVDENLARQIMIMHEIQYLMKTYQYLNKSGN